MSETITDVFADDNETDESTTSTTTPPAKGGAATTTTPPPEREDELKNALAELTKTVAAGQKKEEPKEAPLTAEQEAELWGIYDPKKTKADFMRKFFRMNDDVTPEEEAEAEELFRDMQKGIVRQALKSSMNIHGAELAKLREELQPLKDFYTQTQAREIKTRFEKAYPALADEKFGKIINSVAPSLEGKSFKSEKEYFQALAEGAAEVIKGVIPDFDPSAATPTNQKKSTGTTPRLPRTSAGGTGGAGGGRTTVVEKHGNTDDIFD